MRIRRDSNQNQVNQINRNMSKSQPNITTQKLSFSSDKKVDLVEDDVDINLDEITPSKPPDGGYAWVIMIASFICMVLVDGTCFSYGLLMEELQDSFGTTKMTMTFAGSLITGSYLIFGPVASGLSNFYDHRKLVIIGSIISFLGISLSTFMNNVYGFIVVFGVIGGLGFSLIYLPANTIISIWFFKRRATAIGISACGSGIGGMLFAIIVPMLRNAYSWRGCLFVLSAINLNCAVAGALMIPLEKLQAISTIKQYRKFMWTKDDLAKVDLPEVGTEIEIPPPVERQRSNSENDGPFANQFLKSPTLNGQTQDSVLMNDTANSTLAGSQMFQSNNDMRKSSGKLTISNQNLKDVIRQMAMNQVANERAKKHSMEQTMIKKDSNIYSSQMLVCAETDSGDQLKISSTNIPSQLQMSTVNRLVEEAVVDQLLKTNRNTGHGRNIISSQIHLPTDELNLQHETEFGTAKIAQSTISLSGTRIQHVDGLRDALIEKLRAEVSRPAHRMDYLYSGSMVQLNKMMVSTTNVDEYLKQMQEPEEPDEAHEHPVLVMIKKMLNFEVLRSPTVLLVIIAGVFTMIGYLVPYMFIPNLATTLPGEDRGGEIMRYLSLANTIGRAGAGIISDLPCIDPIWLNNFALLLSGTVLTLVPLMTNSAGLMAVGVIYGGLIAVFVSVRVVVIAQLVGLPKLTNTLGILLLFQGISMIISTPFLAWFYDLFHNYDYTFMLGGAAIITSGLLCFPLTFLSKWEKSQDEDEASIANCFRALSCCRKKTNSIAKEAYQLAGEGFDNNVIDTPKINFNEA